MSDLEEKIAIRTSSLFLAVLLVLTPVTQVLAQAEQQGQESQAGRIEEPDESSEPGAVSQDEEREPALPNARVAETDTVQLLRLGATTFFPKTDSPPAYNSAAATPTAAEMSSGAMTEDAARCPPVVATLVIIALVLVVAWLFIAGPQRD
jgi:hypothetical protein